MKTIAAVQVDLERTSLGTRSRLAENLHGISVLQRTIARILRVKNVSAVHVLCPVAQVDQCRQLLADIDVHADSFESPPPPWAPLVQTARKWSLDGWRGGLGGSCYFDEFTNPVLLRALAERTGAELVLSVPPSAVVFDPELAGAMIDHYIAKTDDSKLTFSQAPPGLAGIVINRTMLTELAQANIPIGWVFAYKPDTPQKDLIFQPCCYEVCADIRFASGRLLADTDRSFARLDDLLRAHPDPDAATAGRWLRQREDEHVEALPREIELELTTEDPYPHSMLHPRGNLVAPRGPLDPLVARELTAELARFDDSLIILAGFGDPLRHPRFRDVLNAIRSVAGDKGNVYGLAVRTTGVDLHDEHIEALLDFGVDILEVTLDAWTQETYAKVQAPANGCKPDLTATLRNLDRLSELRAQRSSVKPIVLPEMTKSRYNVHELDDFHDGWIRRLGAVAISGASHFAGQFPDHSVIRMTPPSREPCRRLHSRCVVLADGRVTLCDQDFNGKHAIGRIGEPTLTEIWQSRAFESIRTGHAERRFDITPLCATCDEWHRP